MLQNDDKSKKVKRKMVGTKTREQEKRERDELQRMERTSGGAKEDVKAELHELRTERDMSPPRPRHAACMAPHASLHDCCTALAARQHTFGDGICLCLLLNPETPNVITMYR